MADGPIQYTIRGDATKAERALAMMHETTRRTLRAIFERDRVTVAVEEIPLPWPHNMGTVIALEDDPERPAVVDLVLAADRHGGPWRTAETRGAMYRFRPSDGRWDLERFT